MTRCRAKKRDEYLPNGSVIYWSRWFKDGRGRRRVPVRCGECGQVREINTKTAWRQDFTGLCHACAMSGKAFQIPRSVLERLYCEEGLSQSEIAERLGCSETPVKKRMSEYGIKARPPGGVLKTLVPEEALREWSPELAYVVGLVTTDGCLVKGCNRVDFPSTDRELIEIYQQCLGVSLHVCTRHEPGHLPCHCVTLNDPAYRRFLEDVGLTPAKTKERTLGPLRIPDEFFRDFFRGVIDGDGTIGVYVDKRWPNSRRLTVRLPSVCRPFLAWIRDTVVRLASSPEAGSAQGAAVKGVLYRQGTEFRLAFTGDKACRLLSWLYYTPDLPCLQRKRAVWEAYMRDHS